jgi:hypothetical protein
VLPCNTTGKFSSINCYAGTVSSSVIAAASKRHCDMKSIAPGRKQPHPAKPMAPMNMSMGM